MSRHLAHSANRDGMEQGLLEHLTGVARLAERFAGKFQAGELGRWAGLWHDLGKFHPDFAAYLASDSRRRGPDHSSAGAVHAASFCELLSFVIGGHHAGLSSRADLVGRLRSKANAATIRQALAIAGGSVPELAPEGSLNGVLPGFLVQVPTAEREPQQGRRTSEMFIRMLFSTLVDADYLDTEAHFTPEHSEGRSRNVCLQDLQSRFQRDQSVLSGQKNDPINQMRHEVYRHVVQAARQPPGFFRLTLPTGAGKTRCGVGFGLEHALHHGLDRVVVGIPFTSIIEQTADVYRGIFGGDDDVVLEHHSALPADADTLEPEPYERDWSRLARQNWDAPIVVTTTVQLFESLFANRPGPCRKLHNLARSVLILDEVQTLPPRLLEPILDVLRELVAHYGVSVVLSTATQPALVDGPYLKGLPEPRELVPEPGRYYRRLQRVRYETPAAKGSWTWMEVAERMRTGPQALAIVNTKKDAMALLDALDDPAAMHLSTLMCGAHRREVLQEVRRRLAHGDPCRLVSTQVVEAGVDLDFPLVLRALGPLDSIVQAAGRCNREGTMAVGQVVIFDPAEGGCPPGAYRSGRDISRELLAEGADLHDPQVYTRYFRRYYEAVELDDERIQPMREAFDFPEVARRFRMIPDDSAPVVVRPKGREVEVDRLLELVRNRGGPPRHVFQCLQPYLIVSFRQACVN